MAIMNLQRIAQLDADEDENKKMIKRMFETPIRYTIFIDKKQHRVSTSVVGFFFSIERFSASCSSSVEEMLQVEEAQFEEFEAQVYLNITYCVSGDAAGSSCTGKRHMSRCGAGPMEADWAQPGSSLSLRTGSMAHQ